MLPCACGNSAEMEVIAAPTPPAAAAAREARGEMKWLTQPERERAEAVYAARAAGRDDQVNERGNGWAD